MRVVVLIEYATETGIEIICELKRLNIPIHSIICVGHYYSKKRNNLLKQRTGGQYKRPKFSELFIDNPIPIYLVDNVNSDYCYNLIQSLNVDLLVFEGSKIIRNPIFDLPKIGMLNVHVALLPYFRGCSCMEWSILQNFPLGVTCHFLIRSVDAGPIIERITLQLQQEDTYADLRTKAIYMVGYAMGQAVHRIVNEGFRYEDGFKHKKGSWFSPMKDPELIAEVQNKIASQTYCPKIIKDDFPLTTVDVEISSGKITVIKRKHSKTTKNIRFKTDGIVNIFDGYRDKWEDFYPSERWAFEKLAGHSGGLGKVLDVGCAIGGLGRTLSKRYRIESYVGVDINPQAIDVAKQNQSQISVPAEFSSGDILELNILDGKTFDTVFSLSCADWNIETDLIIYRCWDFVKPGGVLVISLRLTSQESINDMKRSYQPFAFDDKGNVIETANYVIYNYTDLFSLIKNLRPQASSVIGYGNWGQPPSNTVTPYKDLVFGVLIVSKALDGQLARIESELYFPLDLFT